MINDRLNLKLSAISCNDFHNSFSEKLKHLTMSFFHSTTAIIFIKRSEVESKCWRNCCYL